MPNRPADRRLRIAPAAVLTASLCATAMFFGGCASPASSNWAQTAPSIRPVRSSASDVRLSAFADAEPLPDAPPPVVRN